jgi:hypothetical protein
VIGRINDAPQPTPRRGGTGAAGPDRPDE